MQLQPPAQPALHPLLRVMPKPTNPTVTEMPVRPNVLVNHARPSCSSCAHLLLQCQGPLPVREAQQHALHHGLQLRHADVPQVGGDCQQRLAEACDHRYAAVLDLQTSKRSPSRSVVRYYPLRHASEGQHGLPCRVLAQMLQKHDFKAARQSPDQTRPRQTRPVIPAIPALPLPGTWRTGGPPAPCVPAAPPAPARCQRSK